MAPPIDIIKLLEIMDSNYQLLTECLDDFIEDYGDVLSSIETAINSTNPEMLEKEAHALKGTLQYLAAGPAADLAKQLEKMGKNDDFQKANLSQQNLAKECERIKNFIVDYKTTFPPSLL